MAVCTIGLIVDRFTKVAQPTVSAGERLTAAPRKYGRHISKGYLLETYLTNLMNTMTYPGNIPCVAVTRTHHQRIKHTTRE
jgi:hypothetical protein